MLTNDQILDLFNNDPNIFGFDGIKNKFKLNRPELSKLKLQFSSEYDYIEIRKILLRPKLSKYLNKIRNSKPVKYSKETCKKMKESKQKFFKDIKGTDREKKLKEIFKSNMKTYCNPAAQTDEAKQKRAKSNTGKKRTEETKNKIRNGNLGKECTFETKQKMSISAINRGNVLPVDFKHSKETKKKLSDITKLQWMNGIHKPKFKSTGHSEIESILVSLNYNVINEYIIFGRPYDIYIPNLNLIIEFNGTYWHLDPRKYDINFYDKSKGRYAYQTWEIDKKKLDIAIDFGYNIVTVWQADFESTNNKLEFIKEIIQYYESKIS